MLVKKAGGYQRGWRLQLSVLVQVSYSYLQVAPQLSTVSLQVGNLLLVLQHPENTPTDCLSAYDHLLQVNWHHMKPVKQICELTLPHCSGSLCPSVGSGCWVRSHSEPAAAGKQNTVTMLHFPGLFRTWSLSLSQHCWEQYKQKHWVLLMLIRWWVSGI